MSVESGAARPKIIEWKCGVAEWVSDVGIRISVVCWLLKGTEDSRRAGHRDAAMHI
jgi:hypothetical protein